MFCIVSNEHYYTYSKWVTFSGQEIYRMLSNQVMLSWNKTAFSEAIFKLYATQIGLPV